MLSFARAHQRCTVPSNRFHSLLEYEESTPLKEPVPRGRITLMFPGLACRPSAATGSFRFSLETCFDADEGQGP